MNKKVITCIISLGAALAVSISSAADKPDTATILAKNPSFARVSKIENLGDGSVRYRIRICSVDGCDIAVYGRDLTMLADYAYLYSIYDANYERDDKAFAELVKDAKTRKLDQAVIEVYSAKLHCTESKDAAHCVMRGMEKTKAVVGYSTRDDEGADTFTPFREVD